LTRQQKAVHDKHCVWSAPRGAPYATLGESPAMSGAGVWQSRPGPLKKNRHPVDILDDGRRQRDQGAANVQAQMLTATLTKSKTQNPVATAKSSPRLKLAKIMGLMAQRDRTVRRLNTVGSAKWLALISLAQRSGARRLRQDDRENCSRVQRQRLLVTQLVDTTEGSCELSEWGGDCQ
jgi:hypothetical protein